MRCDGTLVNVNAEVSELLEKLRAGDDTAMSRLADVLYDELRHIAARYLRRERAGHTLEPTALVHEAYLKLLGAGRGGFADRTHFLAVASRVMRQVLVDYARARAAKKRGGDGVAAPVETVIVMADQHAGVENVDLLDLNTALDALAREDARLAQLVEMRYFGGMTAEETAAVLGESLHVVKHDMRFAQAWLRRALEG